MKDNFSDKTKLERKFSFWYHILDSSILGGVQLDKDEYENQVKKIAYFETVIRNFTYRLKIFGPYINI
jgi:hypothetical protein